MKPGHDAFTYGGGAIELSDQDRRLLEDAFHQLEYPSFAAHLANVIGTPIEKGLKLIPPRWYRLLSNPLRTAMGKFLETAVNHLDGIGGRLPRTERFYRCVGLGSGVLGGLFGGPALLMELPFTTLVMLTAIAEIARGEGEDLSQLETRLACLEVFALGGRSKADDAADTGYYGLRLALETAVMRSSRHIAQNGLNRSGAPVLTGFILILSERFGLALSEKAAAELIPVVGALGGALINDLFIRHFQGMAKSHFAIRRLERHYGRDLVKAEYHKLKSVRRSF